MKFPRPIVLRGAKVLAKNAGLVQQERTPDSYSGDAGSSPASGWTGTGCDRCNSAYADHLEIMSVCFKCHATLCPSCMGKGSICPPCTEQVKKEEEEFEKERNDGK